MATRADMLMESAADKRMRQFTEALLLRSALPLDPATWTSLPAQVEFLRDRVSRAFSRRRWLSRHGANTRSN